MEDWRRMGSAKILVVPLRHLIRIKTKCLSGENEEKAVFHFLVVVHSSVVVRRLLPCVGSETPSAEITSSFN